MSSLQSTLDALTIVDTLKACILKQDKVIRGQREEIESLKARIRELEKDRSELNQTREQENPNNTTLTNVRPASPDENSRNTSTHDTIQETPERKQSAGDSTDNSEIFSTPQAPTSPVITITPENGSPIRINTPQNSPGGTPVLGRRETFKSIKRSDSLSRQKQLSKKYELSPELQDRSVRFLERQYGGKEKAHQAARVIQLYYRNYRMDKQFKRIRSYSHTPGKDSFRQKSYSDPISQAASPKLQSPEGTQVTPVIRIKKRKSTDPRVKSILIIDNINSLSNGTSQMYSSIPSPPSDEKPASDQATSLSVEKENPVLERKELEPEKEEKEMQDEKEETRKQSSVSETEHYVKVELVDSLEGSPGDAFLEEKETGGKVPNGDVLRRPRRETFGEEGSVFESDESGDEMMGRGGLSSVDSLDGLCASGLVSTDDDSLSLCSEFEAGTKHQKLETRIGINHFNRKPEKGINYLVGHQVLDDNPEVVARFLLSEPGISKNKLGEYLGNLQNEFNMEVLKCFVQALDFTGMEVDEALRLYQTCFRLPGEAQKIEKLMQDFAEQYVASNPSDEEGAVDAILVLAFAIVMLNTDLHSPNVKRRMTEQDFINNLKGTNNGGDFPRESVLGIYNRIKKKSFVPGKDHVNVVEKLSKKIVGTKSPWTTLSALHRQLRVLTPLSNVRDPNKKEKLHPRVVFLFNDMLVATKERGRAGRVEGIHYYSYKVSFPLIGLKVSTFANDYYKCGIQVYSKLDSRILANFNARDEQTRKVFVDELLDCIEETNAMESDRITTEKQKHLGRFNRSGVDLSRASFTLPKKSKPPAPDTISLIDSASSMESLSTSSLLGTKQLSSSLLNINEGEFTTELKKSSSISSLDSAFAEGDSSRTTPEDLHGSQSMLNRRGLFGKWRQRHNTKSMGKPSPKLSPVPATRKNSTPA